MGAVPVVSPYVLFNGLALAAGLLLVDRRLNERLPHKQHAAYVVLVAAVVVGWLGAHAFEQLVSGRSFGRAGFVFYGGLLSGPGPLRGRGSHLPVAWRLVTTTDVAVVPLLVGQGVGRIGCWLAGCCFGIPIGHEGLRHPTQLYESAFVLVLAAWLARHPERAASALAEMSKPSEFVLARMKANRKERELVVGKGSAVGIGGSSGDVRSEDLVEMQVDNVKAGVFRITPKTPFRPGEYCFYYPPGEGRLFDFGVD